MEKYPNDDILSRDEYKAVCGKGRHYGLESISHCKKCDIYIISQGASNGKEYPNGQSWWTPTFPYTIKIEGVYSHWVIPKEQGTITDATLKTKYLAACAKYGRTSTWTY